MATTYKKKCIVDLVEFESKRQDAQFCSSACRQKAKRGTVTPGQNVPSLEPKSLKSIKKDRTNPATGEVITPEVIEKHQKSADKMNALLEAKGLPQVHMGPKQEFFIDTGIEELNSLTKDHDVLDIGGLPRQKITEIFGTKGSGKSSLVKSIVKDPALQILYVDVEGGLTSPPENVQVIKASLVEEVEEIMVIALDSGEYDLIIIDSIAPLVTKKRFEQDLEGMGAKAKAMSLLVNSVTAHLRPMVDGKHTDAPGTAVVFINQLRDTMNSFGKREFTPGGRSLEFMASFRLEFRSAKGDIIKRKVEGVDKIVGQYIRVRVEKTRYGIKDTEIKYPLMYDKLRDFDAYYKERLKEILG